MAKITNKAYDAVLTRTENLADGAKKHASNDSIKGIIVEKRLRDAKTELEDARELYLQTETDARKAYDAFATKFKEHKQLLSNHIRLAKGALTPQSATLSDFGITPEKPRKVRKPKPNTNSAAPKAA